MAKTFDFNNLVRPTISVVLRDEERTTIRVTTPTEELIERLSAAAPELTEVLKQRDAEMVKQVFQLAADIMSCNLEGIKITAEELRGKYGVALNDLFLFFSAYLDFISEIKNAKN